MGKEFWKVARSMDLNGLGFEFYVYIENFLRWFCRFLPKNWSLEIERGKKIL